MKLDAVVELPGGAAALPQRARRLVEKSVNECSPAATAVICNLMRA
jgi:hypothetical protein